MGYRLAILLLQIVLAMYDIDTQAGERSRRRRRQRVFRQLPPTLPLPPPALLLGRRRRRRRVIYGARCRRKTPHGSDLRRERDELVHEVRRAEVPIELLVRAAVGPGALDEERGEGVRDERRGGAPDGDGLWAVRGEAVGRDVAEEEELLAGRVVPHEEGRGLVVAQRVVLAVQDGHRAHGHAGAEDGLVGRVEV